MLLRACSVDIQQHSVGFMVLKICEISYFEECPYNSNLDCTISVYFYCGFLIKLFFSDYLVSIVQLLLKYLRWNSSHTIKLDFLAGFSLIDLINPYLSFRCNLIGIQGVAHLWAVFLWRKASTQQQTKFSLNSCWSDFQALIWVWILCLDQHRWWKPGLVDRCWDSAGLPICLFFFMQCILKIN